MYVTSIICSVYIYKISIRELFRNKIKLSMLSGVGGTKQAIKFAVAIIASIEDNAELQDRYIQVIDAWEYDGKIVPNAFDPNFDPVLNDEQFTLNDTFVGYPIYDINLHCMLYRYQSCRLFYQQ